ncbi:LOW QUALITY PROTEIN: RBR3 Cell wall protein RBR3 [Candida maltosa Xu316]
MHIPALLLLSFLPTLFAITIKENTVDYGIINLGTCDIDIKKGSYWSIIDNIATAFAGKVTNNGELFITSTSSAIALQVTLASGFGSIVNNGVMSFDSAAANLASSHYNLIGMSFENTGEMYMTSSSALLPSLVSLTAPIWKNTGMMTFHQAKKQSGIVTLGGIAPMRITNEGQICLYNQDYYQTSNGEGCISAQQNGRISLNIYLSFKDQLIVLGDSTSVLHVFGKCPLWPQTVNVAGFGNGNLISLSTPLGSYFQSAYEYDASTGILTLRSSIFTQQFNIGKGYDPDLFSLVDDSWLGLMSNAITYTGPVPSESNSSEKCLRCKNPPVAPGFYGRDFFTTYVRTLNDETKTKTVNVKITKDKDGEWKTTTSEIVPSAIVTETTEFAETTELALTSESEFSIADQSEYETFESTDTSPTTTESSSSQHQSASSDVQSLASKLSLLHAQMLQMASMTQIDELLSVETETDGEIIISETIKEVHESIITDLAESEVDYIELETGSVANGADLFSSDEPINPDKHLTMVNPLAMGFGLGLGFGVDEVESKSLSESFSETVVESKSLSKAFSETVVDNTAEETEDAGEDNNGDDSDDGDVGDNSDGDNSNGDNSDGDNSNGDSGGDSDNEEVFNSSNESQESSSPGFEISDVENKLEEVDGGEHANCDESEYPNNEENNENLKHESDANEGNVSESATASNSQSTTDESLTTHSTSSNTENSSHETGKSTSLDVSGSQTSDSSEIHSTKSSKNESTETGSKSKTTASAATDGSELENSSSLPKSNNSQSSSGDIASGDADLDYLPECAGAFDKFTYQCTTSLSPAGFGSNNQSYAMSPASISDSDDSYKNQASLCTKFGICICLECIVFAVLF